jgi:hypothetical protein
MSQNFIEAMFQGPKDLIMAQKVVKVTVYVSLVITLLTAALAISGLFQTSSDPTLQYLMDPWSLFDVVLMLVFTFFLYKRKLWAPIALVVHQVLSLLIIYIDLNKLPGMLAIFKLVLFISAIRAVHLINNESKKVDEPNE